MSNGISCLINNMKSFFHSSKRGLKRRKNIIKSISALFVGNLGVSILGAFGGLLVAKFIGPEVNGQFRIFTIPLLYLTFLQLGTFQGIQRQIPYYTGLGRPDQVEKIASVAGAWNIGVATLISIVFVGLSFWGLLQYNWGAAAGWFSQAIFCWFIYYGGYLGNTFRTVNNFVTVARIQLVQSVVAFIFVFTVPFFQLYGLCLRLSIPSIICVLLYHRYRPLRMSLKFDFTVFKEVLKIGAPLCFWQNINTSLWVAAESTLMLHFGGVRALGLFSVAIVCRVSVSVLPQAVFQVLKPHIAESYGRQGHMGRELQYYSLLAAVLSGFMILLVWLVSYLLDYFVPIFIPKYIDGIQLMKICNLVAIIHAASLPLNGLFATGKGWLFGKGILAGLLIFPLAVYLLVPIIGGMLAVAVGSLIGNAVWVAVGYIDVIKLIRQEASK